MVGRMAVRTETPTTQFQMAIATLRCVCLCNRIARVNSEQTLFSKNVVLRTDGFYLISHSPIHRHLTINKMQKSFFAFAIRSTASRKNRTENFPCWHCAMLFQQFRMFAFLLRFSLHFLIPILPPFIWVVVCVLLLLLLLFIANDQKITFSLQWLLDCNTNKHSCVLTVGGVDGGWWTWTGVNLK